jgi:2-polyprenyl-3-methyl-5-hydroxy-6-metoxy-1,4-benzoquinol methylase
MTETELQFQKYETRGADYHWRQNSRHPLQMNAFVKARYQKCLALLVEKVGDLDHMKVLDFGCGDGVLTYELARQGAASYGIDLSFTAVQFAQYKHRQLGSTASFCAGSCYETSFPSQYFDALISTEVIEHVQEPERFLREIERGLRVGGTAVISTPVRFTETPLDKMHVIEWFPEAFKNVIRAVFPQAEFAYSHPLFWYEGINWSGKTRLLINLLSFIRNPFLSMGKWRYPCIQYAIIVKE